MNIELEPKQFITIIKEIKSILDLVTLKDPNGYEITLTTKDKQVAFECGKGTEYLKMLIPATIIKPGQITINSNYVSKLKLRGKVLNILKTNEELIFKCGRLKGQFPNMEITKIIPSEMDDMEWHKIVTTPILENLSYVGFNSDLMDNLPILIKSTSTKLNISAQDNIRGASSIRTQGGITLYKKDKLKWYQSFKGFIDHSNKLLKDILKPMDIKKVDKDLLNISINDIKELKGFDIIKHEQGSTFTLNVFHDILTKILKLDSFMEIGFNKDLWGARNDNFLFISARPHNETENVDTFITNILEFKKNHNILSLITSNLQKFIKSEKEEDYLKIFHKILKDKELQSNLSNMLQDNEDMQDNLLLLFDLDLNGSDVKEEEYSGDLNIKLNLNEFKPILEKIMISKYPYISFDVIDSLNAMNGVASVIFENVDNFQIKLETENKIIKCTTEVGNSKGDAFFNMDHIENMQVNLCSKYTLEFLSLLKSGTIKLWEIDNIILEHTKEGIINKIIMPQTDI